MAFWLTAILLYVGTTVLSALIEKANRTGTTPGAPQFPTAEPNKPVPVVYGKVRVGLNVIHKAHLTLGENTVRGTAPFGWAPQHIGYFYTLDLAAVVCWGKVEALWDVIVDGSISLADAGSTRVPLLDSFGVTYAFPAAMSFFLQPNVGVQADVTISAGNILGGKYGRGGIGAGGGAGSAGMMRLVSGSGEVVHNTRFETLNGGPLPTYPNIAVVYFEDFYFGNSEQLPGIELVLSRSVAPWGGTGYLGNFTANSGNDALPGGILYDLLTNSDYGLGLPEGDVDGTSFESVNNACDALLGGDFDFGLSFVLTESRSAKDVLADLVRTLDAVLYTHPTTGLLTIRLLRAPGAGHCDSLSGAPTIDESVLIDGSLSWSESASDATVNEVRVEFPDKARQFTTNVATVRNVAAIQALGRVESRTVQFLGVTNADLAQRLAQRELRALSTSLGRASFEVDRSGYAYTPGQFFYLSYADFGISARVMRVVSVRDTPHGTVAIEAVEDIYSSSTSSFTALTPTEPAPPATQPFIAPYVEEFATIFQVLVEGLLLQYGKLDLFVYDPSGVVTSVEFQTTSGVGIHLPSGYATDAYPYSAEVLCNPDAESTIDYRVTYTDQNGDPQTLDGSVSFPADGYQAAARANAVADTGTSVGIALGQIGIPTTLLNVSEDDQWLALSTIPTAETEVGPEYRQQSYAVGVGSVRIGANIKARTGTPTIGALYSLNEFSSVTSLVSFTPGGTGVQYSGWVAMPSAAKADIGVTFSVGAGTDTAALDLYRVWIEYLPTTVSGARVHTAAFAAAFD